MRSGALGGGEMVVESGWRERRVGVGERCCIGLGLDLKEAAAAAAELLTRAAMEWWWCCGS